MNTLANPPTIYTPTVYYGWINQIADALGKGVMAPSTIDDSLLGPQKNPVTYNYSLAIQNQIGSTMNVDISYVGGISGFGANRAVMTDHGRMWRFVSVEALFNGRHFDKQIIILCVSWYTSFKLSFRDLVIMMAYRGISLAHTTILRWVQHYFGIREALAALRSCCRWVLEMKLTLRFADEGSICTGRWTRLAAPWVSS
jgi:hypothetical protein